MNLPRKLNRRCLDNTLWVRLRSIHAAVSALSGAEISIPSVDVGPPWQTAEALAVLTRHCVQCLHDTDKRADGAAERLCALIAELQQLALDVYIQSVHTMSERMANCSSGLRQLRAMSTSAALIGQVCKDAVERCGLERVVLSRVDGKTWTPWTAYSSSDADLSAWFPHWVDKGIELDGRLPEARLLAEHRPSIVYDTNAETVHRPIIVDAGKSTSYVVVPVHEGSTVVGFLHADHFGVRRVDEVDRDVLWAFAVGFGYIFERTVLLERLRAQRNEVRDILAAAVERIEELCETGADAMRASSQRASGASGEGPIVGAFGELTAREAEVFRLMASGATNAMIADALVITKDTVKSHVKRILSKLGATNRSQAVTWSHTGQTTDMD